MLKAETELYVFAELHGTTGFLPCSTTRLKQNFLKSDPEKDIDTTVRTKDKHVKNKMKEYADKRWRAKTSRIQIGDTVLIRQKKRDKFSTKFDPVPFCVTVLPEQWLLVMPLRWSKWTQEFKYHWGWIWWSTGWSHWEFSYNNLSVGNQLRYPMRHRRPISRYGQNIYDQWTHQTFFSVYSLSPLADNLNRTGHCKCMVEVPGIPAANCIKIPLVYEP